jgi:hypothetical protein
VVACLAGGGIAGTHVRFGLRVASFLAASIELHRRDRKDYAGFLVEAFEIRIGNSPLKGGARRPQEGPPISG